MPYDDPEPEDPQELVGVVMPSGPEATREMAYVFAEEFARFGYDRNHILWLFRNPHYAGAHGAYQTLGAEAIKAIVDECLGVWGQVRQVDRDAPPAEDDPENAAARASNAPARSTRGSQGE